MKRDVYKRQGDGRLDFQTVFHDAVKVHQPFHVFVGHLRHLRGETEELTNIVFMGMGEPLDNVDELFKVLEILKKFLRWRRS